jgi:catechol-2,3-dioxygenase
MRHRQNKLVGIILNVKDPAGLATFYCNTLGMARLDRDGDIAVGFGGQGAELVLRPAAKGPTYQHEADHRYWKIAITLPNLDLAHTQLVRNHIAVSPPRQFQKIAYISHLADPEGHIIELIQHTFAGMPRTSNGDASLPLGGGTQIGLVTLRTDDIDAEKRYFLDELDMTYLSRQAVSDRNFDLYFFAFADEMQPNPDVDSVENREWLWQRPYTTLEFQHRLGGKAVRSAEEGHFGAASVVIENGDRTQTIFS